jgi:predicted metalloprotease
MFAVGRPRLRVRALVVVPIMALVMAMVMVLAACSGSVQGNGSLNATPLAPNSTLPVIGDGHTSFDQLAKNALADVMTFWQTNYPLISGGKPLPPLAGGIYSVVSSAVNSVDRGNECIAQQPKAIANNAFYCVADDSVAYDRTGFLPQLAREFGPYFVALVFAHEFGHAIQARLDINSPSTIDRESQADCAAGAFTASVLDFKSSHFRVSAAELDKVLVGYIQLRDPSGTSSTAEGSHGDGFDRLSALSDGIKNGVTYCYAKDWDNRTFTERPFTTDADYKSGGNEPEAEVLNASPTGGGLQPSLNSFWAAAAKAAGKSWKNVSIAEAAHPPCLAATTSQFNYCPDTNTVYYSQSIADKSYMYGDYALGTLFAYGWGLAVRHQLFALPMTGNAALLAAGCYAGAYSKSVNVTTTTGFELSPPDMDEATVAVLTMVGDPLAYGAQETTGLDRIQSFKTGYFGGLNAC